MARARTAKHPKPEVAETPAEPEPAAKASRNAHGVRIPATKTEAVKMAIAAGFDSPQAGSGYINSMYGMDVSPQHFSSTKSQLKSKEEKSVNGYVAPPPKPAANGEEELLAAMEAMKPLVASLGVEKVKRLADLLG